MTNAMHDMLVLAVNKIKERDFEHLDEIIDEYNYEEIIVAWLEFTKGRQSCSLMKVLREFYTMEPKSLDELEIY